MRSDESYAEPYWPFTSRWSAHISDTCSGNTWVACAPVASCTVIWTLKLPSCVGTPQRTMSPGGPSKFVPLAGRSDMPFGCPETEYVYGAGTPSDTRTVRLQPMPMVQ